MSEDHKIKNKYIRNIKKVPDPPLAIDLSPWRWKCVCSVFKCVASVHVWKCAFVRLHACVCTRGCMLVCWCVFTDDPMPKRKNPTGWINRWCWIMEACSDSCVLPLSVPACPAAWRTEWVVDWLANRLAEGLQFSPRSIPHLLRHGLLCTGQWTTPTHSSLHTIITNTHTHTHTHAPCAKFLFLITCGPQYKIL